MSENNNKQKRKRVCPHCGRKLWMREFYPLKNGGRSSWCHECVLVYKREQYRKHRKVAFTRKARSGKSDIFWQSAPPGTAWDLLR